MHLELRVGQQPLQQLARGGGVLGGRLDELAAVEEQLERQQQRAAQVPRGRGGEVGQLPEQLAQLRRREGRLSEQHGARLGRVGEVGLVLARGSKEHRWQQRRQLRYARAWPASDQTMIEGGEHALACCPRRLSLVFAPRLEHLDRRELH